MLQFPSKQQALESEALYTGLPHLLLIEQLAPNSEQLLYVQSVMQHSESSSVQKVSPEHFLFIGQFCLPRISEQFLATQIPEFTSLEQQNLLSGVEIVCSEHFCLSVQLAPIPPFPKRKLNNPADEIEQF